MSRTIEERARAAAEKINDECCDTSWNAKGDPFGWIDQNEATTIIAAEFADLADEQKYESELDKIRAIVQEKHPVGQIKHIGLLETHEGIVQVLADIEKRLAAVLHVAIETIEGLADQQAMPDDWYEKPLKDLKTQLKSILDGKEGA